MVEGRERVVLVAVNPIDLMVTGNEGVQDLLQHLCPHLADVQHLFMVYLLLVVVVQRNLVGDEGQSEHTQAAVLGHCHLRNCAHASGGKSGIGGVTREGRQRAGG